MKDDSPTTPAVAGRLGRPKLASSFLLGILASSLLLEASAEGHHPPTLAPTALTSGLTSGFETDFDGWSTGDIDQPFTRHSGSTVTPYTGPSAAAVGAFYVVCARAHARACACVQREESGQILTLTLTPTVHRGI